MLTLANTDVSLLYLYDASGEDFIFSSFPVNKEQPRQSPVLYQNTAFSFYGPCQSQSSYNGNPVLILNRTETLPNGKTVILSIESGFYSLLTPLRSAERKSAFLAITNAVGEVVFSTLADKSDTEIIDILLSDRDKNFRSLSKSMSQGWQVHLIIPEHIYVQDYYQSLADILICIMVIAVFVTLIALYFWKSIYSPLRLFDRQLEFLLSDDDSNAVQMRSSIPEYDYLLHKIVLMQGQLQEMIRQIVRQEKTNTKIQIEKLRAQINPHFLLNTLNTVHWMALMNEQEEIDTITQSLSHLLSYNLDKESSRTDLDKELNALTEYVHLQQVRYDFHFCIERPKGNGLNYPCPKFLLQPLVENALAHGYQTGMDIRIRIQVDDLIHLSVTDTGTGIDTETVEKINSLYPSVLQTDKAVSVTEGDVPKFGIGLAYVISSLHDFFSESFQFYIESAENHGTVVTINFPKLKGSGYHAENIDR